MHKRNHPILVTLCSLSIAIGLILIPICFFAIFKPGTPPSGSPRWGSLTVTECLYTYIDRECWGNFASDNHQITRTHLRLIGDYGASYGDHVRAYYDKTGNDAIKPGTQNTIGDIFGIVFGLGMVWGGIVLIRAR